MLICLWLSAICYSQPLRKITNNVFKRGEEFTFDAYYYSLVTGRVSAGEVTLNITKEDKKFYDRSTYHVEGVGKTKGVFNLFYKVIDRYETYIDVETLAPWKFVRRVNESDYKINQDIYFNQFDKGATIYHLKGTRRNFSVKNKKTTEYVQDVVSAFYYARTFDVSNIKLKQEFPIQFLIDDSVYITKIIYEGKENIDTRLGTFRCMKFKPMVLTGNFFKEPYPMTLYISDDNNHIPILVESGILVGSVKLELIKCSGLANPISSLIKQ
jgi:hypothetical protein